MAFFQWQQIDPTVALLAQAMKDAFAAAELDPNGEETFASSTNSEFSTDAGSAQWAAGLAIEGRPQGKVTFAWWTDAVGRRHWYIEGRHAYPQHGQPDPLWRCRRGKPHHPLWVIAPHHVIQQGEVPGTNFLVTCDCGEIGTPESLAWMGSCCGPCHDRRIEDATWVPPPPRAYQAQESSVTGLAFLDEERIVTCGYRDGEVCVRDGLTIRQIPLGDANDGLGMRLAVIAEDRVVVAFSNSTVRCLDVATGEHIWESNCRGELMGLVASPLGDLIAVDGVGCTYLLHTERGEARVLSDDFAECAFSFDSEVLYCFDHNERAIVGIDPISEDLSETGLSFGEPEEDDCYSLVCSPVRRLLASGGDHGRVRLGDPEQGNWLWIHNGPPGLVANLAFTPDGQVLVSGHGSTLAFWDVATGNCLGKLTLPGEGLAALAFSPNGQTLAVGDSQGVVRLLPWRELLEFGVQ